MTHKGQRVLVTGAASGIGAACVAAFEAAGAEAIGADLNPSGDILRVDVSDAASVDQMFGQAGPLDCVVNAAGILIESPIRNMTPEAFDRQISVNLRGSFLVAQGAVRAIPHGHLILIASELAHLGRANFAAYCASKAGVIGLTRALAHECAPDVLVNAVAPGPTDTPMLSADVMSPEALALETQNPLGRIGSPDEIAAAVLFLSSPSASFMTGQTICPSGGAVML